MYPFGVTFYPDQWPENVWEENFKRIKAAGFNIIRFGEMAWDWMEPEEGRFSFHPLDKALNLCHKHGIKVLLGIPVSQVPLWFYRKYPGSRPVAQDGTLYPEYGPRPNICKDNPHYRRLALRLAEKLVQRYKNHPALFYWQVDNEPVYPPLDHTTSNDYCHCDHTRKAFIAWAKKRYGTLNKINEVWGSRFWTGQLSNWDDIRTPKGGIWEAVSPHIFLDWTRFKTETLRDWVSLLAKTVKKIDHHHKVGTNGFVGVPTRVPDHSVMAENLDFYGLDVYPKGNRMGPRDLAFTYDLWRSFCRASGAEFHITELQGGQNVRWGAPEPVDGPEIKWWTEMALHYGAKAILYHAWRPPLFGAETGGFGILRADGSETKRLEVTKRLAKEIATNNPHPYPLSLWERGIKRGEGIAIAYLRSSEIQSYQEQGPPRGIAGQWEPVRTDIGLLHGLDSITGAYHAVYQPGKPIDFIFEQEIEQGVLPYRVILLPNPYLLSKKQYSNLKKWVNNGGTLITEARFGLKDENAHLYPNPLMEDLLGVTYDCTAVTPKGFLDHLVGKPIKPQIITRKIGKGKVVYANYSLFLEIKNRDKKALSLIGRVLRATA